MSKILISTTPKEIFPPNPKRIGFEIQFLPTSIVAGNTDKVFLSVNKIPSASTDGENNEHILIPGASLSRKLADGHSPEEVQGQVWGIAGAANQQCTYKEWLDPTLETT